MELEDRVKQALEQARGYLQSHGGDVEFVELSPDNVVRVKLTGACGGCPMSQITLKLGIEKALRQQIPEITEVVGV